MHGQHSEALVQLSRRIASAIGGGTTSSVDRFSKVNSMIIDVIERLEGDAKADTAYKAYCDEELADTLAKKDKEATLNKLNNQIDTIGFGG